MTRMIVLALAMALTLASCGAAGSGDERAGAPATSKGTTASNAGVETTKAATTREQAAADATSEEAAATNTSTGATRKATKEDTMRGHGGTGAGHAGTGSGGERTPNFSLATLDGKRFNLKAERGNVVALFFTAGWCNDCIPEARGWSKLYPAYKGRGLDLLMISVDPNDTPQTIAGFQSRSGIRPLPWAIDRTGEVSRSLGIRALGSTVIVDREGRIAYRDAYETDSETLKGELEQVL
jgi:peroxiredoxin